jgi:choline dehydrogenase-like flavoprotein
VVGNVFDSDVIVIGSAVGGSVAGLRAAEKGHTTAAPKAGRRWTDDEFRHHEQARSAPTKLARRAEEGG